VIETGDVPLLVPLDVSRAKLKRELAQWHAVRDSYRRRGYWIIDHNDLTVDVGFVGTVPALRPFQALVAIARLSFDNYDVWAPSVRFVDADGDKDLAPLVPAFEEDAAGGMRLIVFDHHELKRTFLCAAGVREYHDHPQHSGDLWLVHRGQGSGRLAVICERLWRAFSLMSIGLRIGIVLTNQGSQVSLGVVGIGIQTVLTPAEGAPEPADLAVDNHPDDASTPGGGAPPAAATEQTEPES
jgi:hypothetical protein